MRNLVFLVLLLPSLLLAASPALKSALRNQVVIDFKNAIVPMISKQIEYLTLPDIHTSSSGFKIDVTNIKVHIVPFQPAQIGIVFVPGSSVIRMSGAGFTMTGSAHIRASWKFIHKGMDADVGVHNAGFNIQITLLSNGGKPNIQVNSVQIGISGGNVSINIHGGLINKIIQFLANLLKGHFVGNIVNQLQGKIPGMVTTTVNAKLNTLPSDINVSPTLNLKYGFPYAPFVRQDYLFTGISGYIHPKNNPNPPPYAPAEMPEFDAQNPKGIQFFFGDYIVKSALDGAFSTGVLTAIASLNLKGHSVKLNCRATRSPSFAFANAIGIIADAECIVDFDNNADNRFIMIASVQFNLVEHVTQAILFFAIRSGSFLKLDYKQPKPVDISWFKNGVNTVLEVLIQVINSDLGQKGIPLPTIKGIDYTDTVQYVRNGYMEICTSPVFHLGTEEN